MGPNVGAHGAHRAARAAAWRPSPTETPRNLPKPFRPHFPTRRLQGARAPTVEGAPMSTGLLCHWPGARHCLTNSAMNSLGHLPLPRDLCSLGCCCLSRRPCRCRMVSPDWEHRAVLRKPRGRRLHLSLLLLWKCAWMAFLHTRRIWTRGAFVRGIFIRGVFVPGIFLRGV